MNKECKGYSIFWSLFEVLSFKYNLKPVENTESERQNFCVVKCMDFMYATIGLLAKQLIRRNAVCMIEVK